MLISTGLPDIMLPLPTRDELNSLSPNMKELSLFSKKWNVVGVHAFTTNLLEGNTSERKVFCRNFAPLYGIDEEAATGTSNGALAYYFYLNKFLDSAGNLKAVQGESMNRPSSIDAYLSPEPEKNGEVTVRVGGSAAILAEGKVHL